MSVDFEALLKATIGLDAASIGSSAIERAVQQRVSACELPDAHAYGELVRASDSELQELIETAVVAETWFFRDRAAFAALGRIVADEWLPAGLHGAVDVLSVPCSTGEEPYSIVMALLDAGIPSNRFRVDAVDVSARALAKARRGVYGSNSFRGGDLGFRERYFEDADGRYRLRDAVRDAVRFHRANLLASDFVPGAERYDAIFCRNLLIYFDRATQERAIAVLHRLLKRSGVLFVGAAETGSLFGNGFIARRAPGAFAFQKGDSVQTPAKPSMPRSPGRRFAPTPAPAPLRPPPPAEPVAKPKTGIEEAVRFADEGRLHEAAVFCQEHVRAHGPTAGTFALMGLISSAGGNLHESAAYLRKALYLDPNSHEALVHLTFVLEKLGDASAAQTLRNRIRRLQP
jgi:chemotaxis protein methyltransferase WspC